MMKRISVGVAITVIVAGALVMAASNATFVVTPSSPVFGDNNVTGVALDAAPGYASGSFKSNGIAKTDMYFTPESLFGGLEVTVGDIASVSYWTKKGTTHTVDAADWYLNIYTKRYAGQLGTSFYGVRIGTEPYFSENVTDPVNTWNQWSSDDPTNQLRFFESTYGFFGSYTDPHWDAFITGTSLAGSRGPGVPYAAQPILFFSPQTATAWAGGFTGQLDGLRIELTNGSVANINFEAFLVATDRDACKKGGWVTLYRADGSVFVNQGDCVSYVNIGK